MQVFYVIFVTGAIFLEVELFPRNFAAQLAIHTLQHSSLALNPFAAPHRTEGGGRVKAN